jgi:hypothetical protein
VIVDDGREMRKDEGAYEGEIERDQIESRVDEGK